MPLPLPSLFLITTTTMKTGVSTTVDDAGSNMVATTVVQKFSRSVGTFGRNFRNLVSPRSNRRGDHEYSSDSTIDSNQPLMEISISTGKTARDPEQTTTSSGATSPSMHGHKMRYSFEVCHPSPML